MPSYHSTNKYHNKRIVVDGVKFDSKKEYNRWMELQILEKAHLISGLKRQIPYVVIPKSKYGRAIKYIADFDYTENGRHIVEDCKGFKTREYLLKRRLMAETYGIEIKET